MGVSYKKDINNVQCWKYAIEQGLGNILMVKWTLVVLWNVLG